MPAKISLFFVLIFSQLFIATPGYSTNKSYKIEQILALQEAPSGVVIEIVTSSENSLNWALPRAQKYIKQLREKFAELDIAIVTHGNEQFALTKKNDKKYKKIHSLTQQLVTDTKVPLHVCGTYASWKNINKEDFPDYVDVTAAGPATINDYIALGYLLIKLKTE